jgi:hypothetical protein
VPAPSTTIYGPLNYETAALLASTSNLEFSYLPEILEQPSSTPITREIVPIDLPLSDDTTASENAPGRLPAPNWTDVCAARTDQTDCQ